jgi:hypothetical protein
MEYIFQDRNNIKQITRIILTKHMFVFIPVFNLISLLHLK